MSKIVTMTSTVGQLTSGSTYRVRSRTAQDLLSQSKATVSVTRKNDSATTGKG